MAIVRDSIADTNLFLIIDIRTVLNFHHIYFVFVTDLSKSLISAFMPLLLWLLFHRMPAVRSFFSIVSMMLAMCRVIMCKKWSIISYRHRLSIDICILSSKESIHTRFFLLPTSSSSSPVRLVYVVCASGVINQILLICSMQQINTTLNLIAVNSNQ